MKLTLIGHDDRYAVEQLQMALFPAGAAIDAACIPTCCREKEAAELFINFLCSPEISGQNLDVLGYSTPISAAKEYMDPATVESEVAYPSEETLENATSFAYLPAEVTRLVEALFQEATKLIE